MSVLQAPTDSRKLFSDDMHQPPFSSSLSSAVGMQRASSSAGLGRANSADASLEALLAELSSASATAAAALAPFTSSSNAQHAAESAVDFTAAVDSNAAVDICAAVDRNAAVESPFASSSQQVQDPTGTELAPASTAVLTNPVGGISPLLTSQLSRHDAASTAPSSSSLSPRSSSPPLAAAPSASSLDSSSQAAVQFVSQLQGEFQQHMGAFDDDLAFIHEVESHQTLAAGMNPNVELQVLHKRFNSWKFDFKVRV